MSLLALTLLIPVVLVATSSPFGLQSLTGENASITCHTVRLALAPTPSPSLTFAHVHTIANWRWRKHTLDWRKREVQEDNSIIFITILLVMPLTSHRMANPCRGVGMWQEIAEAKEEQFKSLFCFWPSSCLSFLPWQDYIEISFFYMPRSLLLPMPPIKLCWRSLYTCRSDHT